MKTILPMKKLTAAEEEIMQILWDLKQAFVRDILNEYKDPKPAYNTVSTIVRILVDKGFVYYNVYNKSHQYYPLISKDEYIKSTLHGLVQNYFSNSYKELVSFFARDERLSPEEVTELLHNMEKKQSSNPS